METLSLVVPELQTVVTLTGTHLPLDPFAETTPAGPQAVSWTSLYVEGIIVGNDLTDSGSEAFGLPIGEYAEVFAHIELVDSDSGLWAVARGEGLDPVGYAELDEHYAVQRWWHALPEGLTRDDLESWGPGAAGPDDLL